MILLPRLVGLSMGFEVPSAFGLLCAWIPFPFHGALHVYAILQKIGWGRYSLLRSLVAMLRSSRWGSGGLEGEVVSALGHRLVQRSR